MSDYTIVVDSSCDLPKELCEKYNIILIPHSVTMGSEKEFKDDGTLTTDEFYKRIVEENIFPKTAFPSLPEFIDLFKEHFEQGRDIICFSISSKFSGSFQALLGIKTSMEEDYPDRKLEVVDSKLVTITEGFAAIEAARMREDGFTIDETVKNITKILDYGRIFVTVDSLAHLTKGGRIGKASALAGAILNIKPVIMMKDGELNPVSKVRGRRKALNEIIELSSKGMIFEPDDYNISVVQSVSLDEANSVIAELENNNNYKNILGPLNVGIIVGAHIGPTAVAICYFPKYEVGLK